MVPSHTRGAPLIYYLMLGYVQVLYKVKLRTHLCLYYDPSWIWSYTQNSIGS